MVIVHGSPVAVLKLVTFWLQAQNHYVILLIKKKNGKSKWVWESSVVLYAVRKEIQVLRRLNAMEDSFEVNLYCIYELV